MRDKNPHQERSYEILNPQRAISPIRGRRANHHRWLGAASLFERHHPHGAAVCLQYPVELASVQLRVSGTVTDDDGVPVSGVSVRIYRGYPSGPPSSAVTDDEGVYRISFLSGEGMSAFTVKEGFLSAWQFHPIATASDLRWDLRIHRLPIRTDGK
jgi:hypothetical protein